MTTTIICVCVKLAKSKIAECISMNKLEQLNQILFLRLNANPDAEGVVLSLAAVVADDFIYVIPLVLLALWLWGGGRERGIALQAVAVTFVALGINQMLAILWPHPRPFMMGLGHTYIAHASDSSFPSDHATVFAGVGLTFVLAGCRVAIGWGVLLLGLCVAWARIYLGVHFPLDMVGAVAVALSVYVAISPLWHRFGAGLASWACAIYLRLLAWPIAKGWIRD
jgi:undecaprenyl-diphosphatase